MARRSTRTRIRFQVEKASKAVDEAVEHLAKADVIADGRHYRINERMPQVVTLLEGVRQVLVQFREEL